MEFHMSHSNCYQIQASPVTQLDYTVTRLQISGAVQNFQMFFVEPFAKINNTIKLTSHFFSFFFNKPPLHQPALSLSLSRSLSAIFSTLTNRYLLSLPYGESDIFGK